MHFRDDINGLRALAVVLVVLYHFQVGPAAGGFVGVDVFFVISGFLMTQIIAGRLAAGRFSLAEFYMARVKRIVPAMVVLVAATFAFGLAVMTPLQLESLARSALSSLLFFSNVQYAHETGYFALPPESNWLIHTWSLSVEWQFYMLFPLAFMALAKLGLRARLVALAVAAVMAVSFGLMLRNFQAGGDFLQAGFFLLQGRAWEFLAGGLCAMLGPALRLGSLPRIALHGAGLGLILLGVALVDKTSAWPSPLAAIPIAGTALVLLAGRERAWWARQAVTRKLGLWSYSIYLWHWPIVAIFAFYGLGSKPAAVAGIVLSVLLGFLSYTLVEKRLTTALWTNRRIGWPLAASAFGGAAALASVAIATHGLESLRYIGRPDMRAALSDYRAAQSDWAFPQACERHKWSTTTFDRCEFGDEGAHDVLVIGDSFAEQLTPRYRHAFDGSGLGVSFVTLGGCVPIPGFEKTTPGSNCERFVEQMYRFAETSDYKRIVFAAFWPGYAQVNLCVDGAASCGADLTPDAFAQKFRAGYQRMAARWKAMRELGKQVIALDVPPYGEGAADPASLYAKAVAGYLVRDASISLADFRAENRESTERLAEAAAVAGVPLVDPALPLCPQGRCPVVIDGRTQYKDLIHLRASIVTQPRFAIFDRVIDPRKGGVEVAQTPAPSIEAKSLASAVATGLEAHAP